MVVVDLTGWSRFRFIGMFAVGLGIGRAMGLVIGRVISAEADVAVGFSGLFLW